MERRLFLQLLGVTGIATMLPARKTTPLLVTEGLPSPKLDLRHYVIEGGSYTGNMFGGNLWSKGKNAAFANDFNLLDFNEDITKKEKPSTFFYSKKDMRKAPWVRIPGVDSRTAAALAVFREQLQRELQTLVSKSWTERTNDTSLVTLIRGPLQVKHSPKKENGIGDLVEVTLHYENYVVNGTVKPQRLWSDCGRIPLQSDFSSNADLHAWFDQKARENIVLDSTDGNLIQPTASRGHRVA